MAGGTVDLPELRAELQLLLSAPDASGAPRWLVHDPVANTFIQIDSETHELLRCWVGARSRADLEGLVRAETGFDVDEAAFDALLKFAHDNHLTCAPHDNDWRALGRDANQRNKKTLTKFLHHYLFFRIPLVRPQKFLEATLDLADMFASRAFTVLVWGLGGLGVYLTSRQWDAYITTAAGFLTLGGTLAMLCCLVLIKALHELGHAFTAVRYGARVSSMGVAFMLMVPLLYTDVTDAWRLTDRRQRMRIDGAGVRVEITLAAIALFLWAFMPDGVARDLAFMISAITLVSSLMINLNPFLRFDGYYLLSEFLGVENLQQRAFALARWQLREWLFGLGLEKPEVLSPRRQRLLVFYAFATWVYRLILFLGIALLVYHLFFKVLGVALFVIEIALLIAKPVWTEVKMWFELRRQIIRSKRSLVTAGACLGLVTLMAIPWSTRVEIPAVLERARVQAVFPPRSGQIAEVLGVQGQSVREGAPLMVLRAPQLDHALTRAQQRLAVAKIKFAQRGAVGRELENSLVLNERAATETRRIRGLHEEITELTVRAPSAGLIVETGKSLHAGRWIAQNEQFFLLADSRAFVAKGYVREDDLWRIGRGDLGSFIPDAITRPNLPVQISAIDVAAETKLAIPELSASHGGTITAAEGPDENIVPKSAHYRVQFQVSDRAATDAYADLAVRGVIHVDGKPESLLARFWRRVLKVAVQEAGV